MAIQELDANQKDLANLLIQTKTLGKVTRRLGEHGSYYLETDTREIGVIAFAERPGEFALKAHEVDINLPLSPFYINLRNLPEEVLLAIARNMAKLNFPKTPDFVTGIPNAGDPIAAAFAKETGIPLIQAFDKIETPDGRLIIPNSNLRTPSMGSNRLLIVDDLTSQAFTKIEAITAALRAGFEVIGIGTVIDRQQGGSQQVEAEGVPHRSVLPIKPTFHHYRTPQSAVRINSHQYISSTNYLDGRAA